MILHSLKKILPVTGLFLLLTVTFLFAGETEKLLNQYYFQIIKNGLVDYSKASRLEGLRAKIGSQLAQSASHVSNSNFSTPEKIALGINIYNFSVIEAVLQEDIKKSVKESAGFFTHKRIPWDGKSVSLDELEKKLLELSGRDARLHLVLICGALSCPPFPARAFSAENLDSQLNEATATALQNPVVVDYDSGSGELSLSKIFEWYKDDFEKTSGSIIEFIRKYSAADIPEGATVRLMAYDWSLNNYSRPEKAQTKSVSLQSYTAATLLLPGQWEIKYFGNIYTQTEFFNESGSKQSAGGKQSYFTGIMSAYTGLSSGLNLGVEIWQKSARFGNNSSNPFLVLWPEQKQGIAATRLAFIVPKGKIALSRLLKGWGLDNLTVESKLQIPLSQNLENAEGLFLDYQSWFWTLHLYNEIPLNSDFLLFTEIASLVRLKSGNRGVTTPVKLFLNYYPNGRVTLYGLSELAPSWDGVSWESYYFQMGGAVKWLLRSNLELELLYTKFLKGKSSGAGETFNLGFRFLF